MRFTSLALEGMHLFEGFQFTLAVRVHLVTACILFMLSPFVVREVSVSADPDHCGRSASGKHDVWLDDIRAALS